MQGRVNSSKNPIEAAISQVVWFFSWLYETHFDVADLDQLSARIHHRLVKLGAQPVDQLMRYLIDQCLIAHNTPANRLDTVRRDGRNVFKAVFARGEIFGDGEIIDEIHRIIERAKPGATGVRPRVAAPGPSRPAPQSYVPPSHPVAATPMKPVLPPVMPPPGPVTPPGFHTPPPPPPPYITQGGPGYGMAPPTQGQLFDQRMLQAMNDQQLRSYVDQRQNWLAQVGYIDKVTNQTISNIWR